MTERKVEGRRGASSSDAAIITAGVQLLKRSGRLDMRRLASEANLSRSTLYRHFANADAVERAILERALAEARAETRSALSDRRPTLALLRTVISTLVAIGARYPLERICGPSLGAHARHVARELGPLVEPLRDLIELDRAPPAEWLNEAAAHLVEVALLSGGRPRRVADDLAAALTEPLDRGLVLLDASGRLLASNALASEPLGLGREMPRQMTAPRAAVTYSDGSACPPDGYPLARAIATRQTQRPAVLQHRTLDGSSRWFSVAAIALRRSPDRRPYGIVGVFADVTAQRQADLARLRPPGTLAAEGPRILDVARALDEVPSHLLPEQVVAEARRLVRGPVALYVVDIDGSHLLRLAGAEEFPAEIEAPLALGPELAQDGLPELRARLERSVPGLAMAPLWLRGRAVGVLLALRGSEQTLADVALQAAPAIELANGQTDVLDAARRRKEINPAAEIQQSLLPPRIARFGGGEVASGMLPSYEVGGDWFDYVENRDGGWIAIADAAGRGARAGALGSIGLAALRAARRNNASLEEAVETIHTTVCDAGEDEFYLTAIVARWSPAYSSFSWINAGHPRPLLLHAHGNVEELVGEPTLPLGVGSRERRFSRSYRRLAPDDRLVLYTDGISQRASSDGFFGKEGIVRAARSSHEPTAPGIARSIQEAVTAASGEPLRDDAAVVVLAPER